jgi:hypothetical protein
MSGFDLAGKLGALCLLLLFLIVFVPVAFILVHAFLGTGGTVAVAILVSLVVAVPFMARKNRPRP